jgi:hypothetical protein
MLRKCELNLDSGASRYAHSDTPLFPLKSSNVFFTSCNICQIFKKVHTSWSYTEIFNLLSFRNPR